MAACSRSATARRAWAVLYKASRLSRHVSHSQGRVPAIGISSFACGIGKRPRPRSVAGLQGRAVGAVTVGVALLVAVSAVVGDPVVGNRGN